MEIDFSKTDLLSAAPGAAVTCIYMVKGDCHYRGSQPFNMLRKGNVAIRTFGGAGRIFFWDGQSMEVTENTLLIVPHAKISHYHTKQDKWYFWWFEYENTGGIIPEEHIFSLCFEQEEENLCTAALRSLQEKEVLSCAEASAFLSALLCRWRKQTNKLLALKPDSRIYALIQQIRRCPRAAYTLADMADACCLSQRRLRDLFQLHTGTSPKKFLIKVRMEQAGDLLLHTGLTVGEVAENCGYNDGLYFSRLFKAYYGAAPSAFRTGVCGTELK